MIEISYSENELDISGTIDELQEVRQKIIAFLDSNISSLVIEANPNFDPQPYLLTIPKMVIEKGQDPIKVSVVNANEVNVKGALESLEGFESFFDFDPGAKSGAHSHYEYYEGNEWVAQNSITLVIGIK